MTCSCNLVGLLNTSYRGIFSAAINGSTEIEVAEDGTVLLGSTQNNLSIGAYAFLPGQDRYLGASCPASAQAQLPWITRRDCSGNVYFIPRSGGKASITNGPIDGVSLECSPGIVDTSFQADAGGGPASPFVSANRVDGFNLIYTGNPIPIDSGYPKMYTINLGFVGSISAYLQSFSLSVNPPDVARVQYSFVFIGAGI